MSAGRGVRRSLAVVLGAVGACLVLLLVVTRLVPSRQLTSVPRRPALVTRVVTSPVTPPTTATVTTASHRHTWGVAVATTAPVATPLPPLPRIPVGPGDPAALLPCDLPGLAGFDPALLDLPEATMATTRAIPIDPIDPARFYPPRLRRRGVEGQTRLVLRVDRDGSATIERIEASTPGFEEAARRLVADLRFVPAQQGAATVTSLYALTVTWQVR